MRIPETIKDVSTWLCPGCGHGIIIRCLTEAAKELGESENMIIVMDVACGAFLESTVTYNYLGAAHGRPMVAAAGVKRVRKDDIVVAHAGDGAAYSIGIESTIHCALRNENILAIVVNNCVFGMTGGQMSPTSFIGQKTTSSQDGRNKERFGSTFDVVKTLSKYPIAYLARGSVHSPKEVIKTKAMLKKAITKQRAEKGFCLVEVISPCPTNWGVSPVDALGVIESEILKVFKLGEFITED